MMPRGCQKSRARALWREQNLQYMCRGAAQSELKVCSCESRVSDGGKTNFRCKARGMLTWGDLIAAAMVLEPRVSPFSGRGYHP